MGGTFDPIHHGHLLVAQAAMETLGLDELWFVPAREQPFKQGRHSAPAAHRARMVELAIAGEGRSVDVVAGTANGEDWRARIVEHPDLRAFSVPP